MFISASMLLGTACTKTLPKEGMETMLTSAYQKKGIALKSVQCPAGRAVKAGDTFECTGELTDTGDKVTFAITQKDDKGNITMDLLGLYVTSEDVAKALTGASGKVTATCPKKITVLRKNESTTCDVSDGADKGKVVITANADESKLDMKLQLEGKPAEDKVVAQEAPEAQDAPE